MTVNSLETLARFKHEVLGTENIPRDLEVLAWATITDAGTPFDELALFAILPDEKDELLNELVFGHDYLSEDELANPDIQANIVAIEQVARMITFVAKDDDSNIYGYWRGKSGRAIEDSPIVQYDTEGQFNIMPGASLTEAFCASYCFEDDELFEEMKEQFADLDVYFVCDSWQDVYDSETELEDEPSELHSEIYNAERVKKGLPPIE
ncbi:hypothetical protein [Wielerella bovis]|uniref:hypothetical protein n=1 Tax=Wielerella bovis TaxID=2917790 RepID=UPI002018BEA6|nr:hypothetical protein [Wielerella bovis]ULJ61080.1 hypothetical protein MIS44_04280 [Wielerella bovis]